MVCLLLIICSEIGSDLFTGYGEQLSVGTNWSLAVEGYQIMERAILQTLTYNLTLVSWKHVDHKVSAEILSSKHENKHRSHYEACAKHLLLLIQAKKVIKVTDSLAPKVRDSPVGQAVSYSALTDTNQEAAWWFAHQHVLGLPVKHMQQLM